MLQSRRVLIVTILDINCKAQSMSSGTILCINSYYIRYKLSTDYIDFAWIEVLIVTILDINTLSTLYTYSVRIVVLIVTILDINYI